MITVAQIKAARAMLDLKQSDLAQMANLSTGTLNNIERGMQTDPKISTLRSIQHCLEKAGIEFVERNGEGVGVCLKAEPVMRKVHTILIIDDATTDRRLYKNWLSKPSGINCAVVEADNARDGYETFVKHAPSCIVLDFMMYGKDGFQLLVEMKKSQTKLPPIIFVTASPSEKIRKEVLAIGVHAYLDKKTLTKERLCHAVRQALSRGDACG